jgi:hypothetical protein
MTESFRVARRVWVKTTILCSQCERRVHVHQFSKSDGRCTDCRAVSQLLAIYWRKKGMPIRATRGQRQWWLPRLRTEVAA